jgi:hypothetical protein
MQRYTVYLYLDTALHVSGGTSTHHQECIQLYLQHLVFITPLLLSAAIVEDFEPVWVCCGWRTPSTAHSNRSMYPSTNTRCVWYFAYQQLSANYWPLSEEVSIFTADETWPVRNLNRFLRRLSYLGSQMNQTNSISREIQARSLSGNRCYYTYGKLMKSRALSRSSELKICKS